MATMQRTVAEVQLKPFLPAGCTGTELIPRELPPVPRKVERELSVLEQASISMNSRRMPASTKSAVINAQMSEGMIEINIAAMAREDVEVFVTKLRKCVSKVQVLKLRSLAKGAVTSAYDMAEDNDPRAANRPLPYHSQGHTHALAIASAHVQHANVRMRLYSTLLDVLLKSDIRELEVGVRLSHSGYVTLAKGLPHCPTLRRLSFAGSHMGDAALEALKPGLCDTPHLEELDLTACALTDSGAVCVGAVIKAGAMRRVGMGWEAGLRQYPDLSLAPGTSRLRHYLAMRDIAGQVDDECGGLLHVEMAENGQVGDKGAMALREALTFDRRMVLLSLRGCGLSGALESEFVGLMREHRALARVDLRACSGRGGKDMGILKLRKNVAPVQLTAAGFARGATQPMSPAMTMRSATLWEVLEADAAEGGGRMMGIARPGGDELGPSPWASPRGSVASSTPHEFKSSMSMVSWGDEQLLRGAAEPATPRRSALKHPPAIPGGAPHTPKSTSAGGGEDSQGVSPSSTHGVKKHVTLSLLQGQGGPRSEGGGDKFFEPLMPSHTDPPLPSPNTLRREMAAAQAAAQAETMHGTASSAPDTAARRKARRAAKGKASTKPTQRSGGGGAGRKKKSRKRGRVLKASKGVDTSSLQGDQGEVRVAQGGPGVQHRDQAQEGPADVPADATEVAEVVMLLRDLDIAVAAAEYEAAVRQAERQEQQREAQERARFLHPGRRPPHHRHPPDSQWAPRPPPAPAPFQRSLSSTGPTAHYGPGSTHPSLTASSGVIGSALRGAMHVRPPAPAPPSSAPAPVSHPTSSLPHAQWRGSFASLEALASDMQRASHSPSLDNVHEPLSTGSLTFPAHPTQHHHTHHTHNAHQHPAQHHLAMGHSAPHPTSSITARWAAEAVGHGVAPGSLPPMVPDRVEEVAEQLERWCNMCDAVLPHEYGGGGGRP